MTWKPRQIRKYVKTPLQLEVLEDRWLLAVAAFAVNLYQDNGGTPGALIAAFGFGASAQSSGDSVQVGEKFFAEVTAQEFDPSTDGLYAVALNIGWDPKVLTEIDTPFNPSALITPNLPAFQSGTLDNAAGEIQNLSGVAFTSSNLGKPIGNFGPERFALLHFEATQSGSSRLTLDQGGSRIVTVGTLPDSQINFESPTITIIAPSVAPPAATAATDTTTPPTGAVSAGTSAPITTPPNAPPPGNAAPAATSSQPATTNSPSTVTQGTTTPPTALPSASAADIGLETHLYSDVGGQPGSLIPQGSVAVGESFFVQIAAQDLRRLPQGIGGLSVNVSWNPAVFNEIDQPFNPSSTGSQLVTPAFPLFRSGSLDNVAGRIEDLGGVSFRSSGSGEAIGATGSESFSLLHFRAIATATASPLSLAIGSSGIGLVGETAGDNPAVTVAPQNVTVVAQQSPPQITVTDTSGSDPGTIQFTTDVGSGPTAAASTLVRPAFPDTKQFVDIKNTGGSNLTISQIQVNARDVTTDVPPISNAAGDLVLAPGQTQRIHLTYAPSTPNPQNTSTESFNAPNGLVIVSNAASAPQIHIALAGASTYDADINYDGRANITDVVLLDGEMGRPVGEASFDRSADPNGDGTIDFADFGLLNVDYGLSRSAPLAGPTTQAASTATAIATSAPPAAVLLLLVPASVATKPVSPGIGPAAADAVFAKQSSNPTPADSLAGSDNELLSALAAAVVAGQNDAHVVWAPQPAWRS